MAYNWDGVMATGYQVFIYHGKTAYIGNGGAPVYDGQILYNTDNYTGGLSLHTFEYYLSDSSGPTKYSFSVGSGYTYPPNSGFSIYSSGGSYLGKIYYINNMNYLAWGSTYKSSHSGGAWYDTRSGVRITDGYGYYVYLPSGSRVCFGPIGSYRNGLTKDTSTSGRKLVQLWGYYEPDGTFVNLNYWYVEIDDYNDSPSTYGVNTY